MRKLPPALLATLLIGSFATSMVVPATLQANDLRGIWQNNQGVRKFDGKRSVEAYDRFNDAMVDLPFSPEVHYNLGNSFLTNKEYDKALNEYSQATRFSTGNSKKERDTRFKALFNSAVVLTELKRIDEAIDQYQRALEINPDSIETKTNIELLAQSQSGGGEGQDQEKKQDQGGDKKDQKQGQGDQDQEKQQQPQQPQNQGQKPKPSPRPFKSEDLSQQDVNRILEELKRQEDSIREKMNKEGSKDAPKDKDW